MKGKENWQIRLDIRKFFVVKVVKQVAQRNASSLELFKARLNGALSHGLVEGVSACGRGLKHYCL